MEDIEIIAPDGSIVVFPAGTPESVMLEAMRREFGGPDQPRQQQRQPAPQGAPQAPPEQQGMSEEEALRLANMPVGEPEDPIIQEYRRLTGYEGPLNALRPGDAGYNPSINELDPTIGAVIDPSLPPTPIDDAIRSLPTGIIQGVTGLAGLPGTLREAMGGASPMGGPLNVWPSGRQIDAPIQEVIGEYHQPETVPGQYSRTIGEFAGGALVPGGVGARAASVLLPAVASETAGQLTQGTAMEPWARGAGGLLGGGLAALASQPSGAVRGIASAAEGVTPEQIQLAQQLMDASPVRLTAAEAIQQVTGGASGMGRLQQVVEGTQGGRQVLGPVMAERPGQVQQAIAAVLDQIGPSPVSPSASAGAAREGAENVVNTLRQRVNESARPLYEQLPGQELAPEAFAQLADNPSYAMAAGRVQNDPELARLLTGAPQDLSTVNRVVQQLDSMVDQATPSPMNMQGGNRLLASERSQARQLADQLASEASPEWRQARQTVATGRQAFVEPVAAGPVGRIGQTDNLSEQASALYPRTPAEGAAEETALAIRLLNEVDPSVGPALTRQRLATQAEEANRALQGGANEWAGAKFAVGVAGGPEQRRTLMAGLREAAPEAVPDTELLLEALMATGRRPRPGSQTAFNDVDLAALSEGGGAQRAAMSINPTTWPGVARDALRQQTLQNNAEQIARMLLEGPEAINRGRGLIRPGTRRARTAVGLLGFGEEE